MKALLDGLKALGPARLAALGAVGLGLLVMLGVLMLRANDPRYALLYGELDMREGAQIADVLGRQHTPFQVAGGGSQILVPADDVPRLRLALAKEGLPTGGTVGYEIFDRTDAMTSSQFQQQINQARALEGELARSIRAMAFVRAARVHLVLPKREPFARERQEAQASVMLTMAGAARLDREAVQAIVTLVAAAVPGLKAQNVTIVDARGSVLARAGGPLGGGAAAEGAEELRRATELRLGRAVEEMLERSLGPGHVRAEAAVEMDFDHVQETQERYDPDNQVPRSQQSVTNSSKSTEKDGSVSVQNNLPNADAGATGSGSQENRQEETTNFEIGRTVRTLVREQPSIRRISLAVMVDGTTTAGADGKPIWTPRAAEDITRLTKLVEGAIGFDAKRGDHVEVESLRFADAEDMPAATPAGLLGLTLERGDVMRLAETGVLGLIALVALLLVFRPMVARLTLAPAGLLAGATGAAALASSAGAIAATGPAALPAPAGLQIGGPGGFPALPGPSAAAAGGMPADDESMVNLLNIEGQLRASSIRRIAQMVDKHPEATLTIVRNWMAQEAG